MLKITQELAIKGCVCVFFDTKRKIFPLKNFETPEYCISSCCSFRTPINISQNRAWLAKYNQVFRNIRSLFVSSRSETGSPLSHGHCPSVGSCFLTHFIRVLLFLTLWIAACQAPLSLGFSREEYWSGLAFPSTEDLPDPGIKSCLLCLLHCRRILYHCATWEVVQFILYNACVVL